MDLEKEVKKLEQLIDSDVVKEGLSFQEDLHKRLIFGQSRYVCRYGTLSDGHEKITEAQRYYQAIKEMYNLAVNIHSQKSLAMFAEADIMDASADLEAAQKESDKLRAKAKLIRAQHQLAQALITVEDQLRMIDEYNKVRLELKDKVEAKYPLGIEQAEEDNWKAVYEYRMLKGPAMGSIERIDNIPLDAITKAEMGIKFKRVDSIAPLAIMEKELFESIPNEDPKKLEKLVEEARKLKAQKELEYKNSDKKENV